MRLCLVVVSFLTLTTLCEGSLQPRFSITLQNSVTFDDCVRICASSGGFLATPISAGEHEIIASILGPYNTGGVVVASPLGGNRLYDGVNYRWVTGPFGKLNDGHGAIFYRGISKGTCVANIQCNWNPGEPNNFNGNNETTVSVNENGRWNDFNANQLYASCICQHTVVHTLSPLVTVSHSMSSSCSDEFLSHSKSVVDSTSLTAPSKPHTVTVSLQISRSVATQSLSIPFFISRTVSTTASRSTSPTMSHTRLVPSLSGTLQSTPTSTNENNSASVTSSVSPSSTNSINIESSSGSVTRSVSPDNLVCFPGVSYALTVNATNSGAAVLEPSSSQEGNRSLEIVYSESLPAASSIRFSLRGLQREGSIVSALLNGDMIDKFLEFFDSPVGFTDIVLPITGAFRPTPYTAQALSIVLLYRCNFFDLFPAQLNLTVSVIPLQLPSSTAAVATPAASAVGLSSVSAGVTSPGMMSRMSAASDMLQCSDALTAVDRVPQGGLVAVSVASDGDPLAGDVNAVVGNIIVVTAAAAVALCFIGCASAWTGEPLAVPALRLHFPSVVLPAFAASLSSTVGAVVDLSVKASSAHHVVVAVIAFCVWGAYIVCVGAIAMLPSQMNCKLSSREVSRSNSSSLVGTVLAILTAVFAPTQRWLVLDAELGSPSRTCPRDRAQTFIDSSKVVLQDVRYPWYPLFDACLTLLCAIVVSSPRSAANTCTVQFAVVIGCMALQLLVNVALRPFTSLFSVLFGVLMVALCTVSVSCQVYLKLNEKISDGISAAASGCALAAVALSMVRSIVDAAYLCALVGRFVMWTSASKRRAALPMEETSDPPESNTDFVVSLNPDQSCPEEQSACDSDPEDHERLAFDAMLQRFDHTGGANGCDSLDLLTVANTNADRARARHDEGSMSAELAEGSLMHELRALVGNSDAWRDNGRDVFDDLDLAP